MNQGTKTLKSMNTLYVDMKIRTDNLEKGGITRREGCKVIASEMAMETRKPEPFF